MPGQHGLVPGLEEQTPGRPAQQIQQLRNACGCKSGMVIMLLCLAGYVTYERHLSSHAGSVQRVLTGFGITVAGAVVGKLAGLLWAHARLVRLLRQQRRGQANV
jgi:hypothetical protein